MAYFVRIGAIHTNQSGVGSRGYQLLRRGRALIMRWGPVEVKRGPDFTWIWKQERSRKFPSDAIAKQEFVKRLNERKKNKYTALPNGTRIT